MYIWIYFCNTILYITLGFMSNQQFFHIAYEFCAPLWLMVVVATAAAAAWSSKSLWMIVPICTIHYTHHTSHIIHTYIVQSTYRTDLIFSSNLINTEKKIVRFSCARRNDNSFNQSTNWLTTMIFSRKKKIQRLKNIISVTYHLWHKSMWFFHLVVSLIHRTFFFSVL